MFETFKNMHKLYIHKQLYLVYFYDLNLEYFVSSLSIHKRNIYKSSDLAFGTF